MSAFVVHTDQIDLLVTHMLGRPSERFYVHASDDVLEALGNGWSRVAEAGHLSHTPWATYYEVTHETATLTGLLLLEENITSVQHRYPADTPTELPGPNNLLELLARYEYRSTGVDLPPIAVMKALHGYRYQACEHPGWTTSLAHSLVERLQQGLIERIPGYRDAETWTYTRPAPAARTTRPTLGSL